MSREIRRVPAEWEHPRDSSGHFRALHDETFEAASREWWEKAKQWHERPEELEGSDRKWQKKYPWYWEWSGGSPDEESYRPVFTSEPTHYQIYETVSEGSPCSPVFASLDEMIEWMTQPIDRSLTDYNRGADWQCMQGRALESAKAFCGAGSSVGSFVISDGKFTDGVDAVAALSKDGGK